MIIKKQSQKAAKRSLNINTMKSFITASFISMACITGIYSQGITQEEQVKPNQVLMPYNRIIQPTGLQLYFGDKALENHAMDAALSPDGKWLAVEERYSIVFISTVEKKISFILDIDTHADLQGGSNTYSGITWNTGTNCTEVLWSCVGKGNKSYVCSALWDGQKAVFGKMHLFNIEPPARIALPNELIVTSESGKKYLYVVLNGNNTVVKQNLETDEPVWKTYPGVAPYGVTMANGKIYVTNWAGRIPDEGDRDVAGIPWGSARVDNINSGGATREGSVAVIDPETGKIIKQIIVGLHPNDIISDAAGKFVYVSNSNSDNVSVINTSADNVSETISVRLQPEINPFFGDSPNGLCIAPDSKTLYVANGMDNALAVIRLGKNATSKAKSEISQVTGFIPTGAYPSSVSIFRNQHLYVCNIEAAGARVALNNKSTQNPVYNSHNMLASVSIIRVPNTKVLQTLTDTVIAVNNLSRATAAMEKPREKVSPKPVPERIGEPSVFKHVVYIIKENRTYDQILGDMKKGKGDPGLCIYGEEITPNTHKLADEFILLDNFHVSGKCSAEGHQWTDASIVTDYIEKNMRTWFRSYPHVQTDAMVYAPTGFLWDNALRKGKSVRIYGEASVPELDNKLKWIDIYKKFKKGETIEFKNVTTIEPVKNILSQEYPSYGNHEFSDTMRADVLIKELNKFEKMEGDKLPELMIVALPNDHTAGIRPGSPTPRAMVADNDAALGRIVEAFTKSRFWENTVIFVVEDDSQGGWDHVSAYRTVSLVISPYSRMKNVNHTYYTQPCLVRTIEQILGLPPMNIQDAIANPMTSCFTSTPDLTPYKAEPARIRIDEMNAALSELNGKALHFAKKSLLPEFDKVDSGDDDLLNRILWFAAKGNTSYPSKYAGADSEEEDGD